MRAGINGWWLLCKLQSNIAVHYGILETIGETQQKQTTQMPREREREETNAFLSAIFRLSPIITSTILKSSTDQRMLSLKFTPAQMNGNETGCYANDFQETSKWVRNATKKFSFDSCFVAYTDRQGLPLSFTYRQCALLSNVNHVLNTLHCSAAPFCSLFSSSKSQEVFFLL